ncbi:MAG TPA: hypothetical protein VMB25_18080 [Bryobacteraceae bacterium]|nr:hypothetical protein [Bryobacteraceae bacterium]
MDKRFLMFFGAGVVVIAIAVTLVLTSNKGSHLALQGEVLKVRSGELDAQNTIAVLDFRLENPSNVPFVVKDVVVTLTPQKGDPVDGVNVSKSDLKRLFQYNRFLGDQYNDGLSIEDTIPPHGKVDRMVATRFEVSRPDMESAKSVRLHIEDVDGPMFETTYNLK